MTQQKVESRNSGKIERAQSAERQALATLRRHNYCLKALANYNMVMAKVEKRLR